jgi:hypothetical protein
MVQHVTITRGATKSSQNVISFEYYFEFCQVSINLQHFTMKMISTKQLIPYLIVEIAHKKHTKKKHFFSIIIIIMSITILA